MAFDATIGTAQDYSTIPLWLAAIPDVDSGSKQPVFGRMTDETFSETGLDIAVSNWTPDASNFITLTDQDGSFDGKPGNGPTISGDSAFVQLLLLSESFTCINNIEIISTGQNGAGIKINLPNCNVEKSIFKGTGTNHTAVIISSTSKLVNSLIYDSTIGFTIGEFVSGAKALNITVHNCVTGVNVPGTNGTNNQLNNLIVFDCTDDFDVTPGRVSSFDYNASDDGDGTNSIAPSGGDWANEFTDYPNDDFSILNSGNVYLGSELTNADDSDIPTDDIIGTARNTGIGEQTSPGCFEFLASIVTLSPNKLNQSQSIDNLDLVHHHVLSIDPLNQPQSIDNLTLSILISLQIQATSQGQTSEVLNLIQHNVLNVDDTDQSQDIDNITLSIGITLQINGINQPQDIESFPLIQHNILSIDSVDQPQTLENIILQSGVILQIAKIVQNQSSDNLNLTQHNILDITELIQSQIIDNIDFGQIVGKVIITLTLKPGIELGLELKKQPGIDLELKQTTINITRN